MLAILEKVQDHYTARFERTIQHPAQEVWAYLTDNAKLAKWFAELKVEDLREGGTIRFDMQDGTFIDMKITDLRSGSVLAYEWAEDHVRFELHPEAGDGEGCVLVLVETIHQITDHTPRDLAGWHVCLDVIEALLDGRTIESRKDVWNQLYPLYVEAVQTATGAGQASF